MQHWKLSVNTDRDIDGLWINDFPEAHRMAQLPMTNVQFVVRISVANTPIFCPASYIADTGDTMASQAISIRK